jgi:RNA polymerase sigma-70 factor (ECF subfamily)
LTIQDKVSLGRYAYPPREDGVGERDRLLVEAHLRRDNDAFAIIVDDHSAALLAQARRKLGSEGAAEDVVQETFERALRGIHRVGMSGEYRLGGWLSQILTNVIRDHQRRLYREWEAALASVADVSPEPDVSEQVGDPVVAAQLEEAVQSLPANQRAAFVMHAVDGLAYADVARELNITEDNARARVSRSRGQLRRVTASLRTAASAIVAVPVGLRALQSRLTRPFHRDDSGVLTTGDRVATQLSASPVTQTAMSLISSAPRGTLVFGIAATVATLGATSLAITGSGGSPRLQAAPAAAVSAPASAAGPAAGAGAVSVPSAPAGTSGTDSTSFAWANPSGSGGTAAASPAAGFAAVTCPSTNGVTPPGSGFSAGTALGLANGQAVADTAAVDLPTTGPALSFNSPATITPYGSSVPTGTAEFSSNVCLSSNGSWLTASITGLPGPQVELQGTLQEVVGSGGDMGYIFRGTLNPSGVITGPLAGAVQFVANVRVLEPDNTAELTVVFLGTSPETGPPNGSIPTAASAPTQPTSSATTAGIGDAQPTGVSGMAPTALPGAGTTPTAIPGDGGTLQGGSVFDASGGSGAAPSPAIMG